MWLFASKSRASRVTPWAAGTLPNLRPITSNADALKHVSSTEALLLIFQQKATLNSKGAAGLEEEPVQPNFSSCILNSCRRRRLATSVC
jgi:hypothetical protein